MSDLERRILALETSGSRGSVALASVAEGATEPGPATDLSRILLGEMELPERQRHASGLLPAVEQMLSRQGWQANSLTDVFVSIGPGSFTGLRIGVSIARTLAWSTGVRVQPVSTFDALACNGLQADGAEHVAVVIDAKKAKAFLASFHLKDGWFEPGLSGRMGDVADFLAECEKPLAVLGEGIPRHQQAIDDAKVRVLPESQWHGRASNVIRVGLSAGSDGSSCPANELEPYYIRRPEPEEKWEQQHGRAPADGS